MYLMRTAEWGGRIPSVACVIELCADISEWRLHRRTPGRSESRYANTLLTTSPKTTDWVSGNNFRINDVFPTQFIGVETELATTSSR